MKRKLRMGMIGGGRGALAAASHRLAAETSGRFKLVAGAFSNDRLKSRDFGIELGLDPQRVYGSYRDMFRREARLASDQRLDCVSIVTPTNMHYPVSMAAMDAGMHVICETPMTTSLDEARNLKRKFDQSGVIFCLTQHHAGWPAVRKARRLVRDGAIGSVRKVVSEYPQGWLAERIEARGQKQAAWRTYPPNSGNNCCLSDVAGIAFHLAGYITGLTAAEICCDLTTFVNGRMLDDDATVLTRYQEGARGLIWATQIGIGEEHGLKIRIYGSEGTLVWQMSDPHILRLLRKTGNETISVPAQEVPALPPVSDDIPKGYPDTAVEPLIELYSAFAAAVTGRPVDRRFSAEDAALPAIDDGIAVAEFVAAALNSSTSDRKWVTL